MWCGISSRHPSSWRHCARWDTQCQDSALVLRLGTNVTVFFVPANHGAWHVGVAANAAQQPQLSQQTSSAMAADLWVSARWVTQRRNTWPNAWGNDLGCLLHLRRALSRAGSPHCCVKSSLFVWSPHESSPARCTCTSLSSCMHDEPARNHPPWAGFIGPPFHEACTTTYSDCLLAECFLEMNLSWAWWLWINDRDQPKPSTRRVAENGKRSRPNTQTKQAWREQDGPGAAANFASPRYIKKKRSARTRLTW